MSKLETDIYLMTTFSKEFKKIEDECRQKAASSSANICSEDLSSLKINKVYDSDDVAENPKVLATVNDILSQCGLYAWLAKKDLEKQKKNPGANVIFLKFIPTF